MLSFDFMKQWLLSVIVTVIIVSVITTAFPRGKIYNLIKAVMGILLSIVIVKPILTVDFSTISISNMFSEEQISYQDDFLEYVDNSQLKHYEKKTLEILFFCGIKVRPSELNIIVDKQSNGLLQVKKIIVNLSNAVIQEDGKHIDIIEQAKYKLSDFFGLKWEEIVFND